MQKSSKHTNQQSKQNNSKKRKYQEINNEEKNVDLSIPTSLDGWISATKTRNAIYKDWLLDWLDLYGTSKGYTSDEKNSGYDDRLDFKKFIMNQGTLFETSIIERLKNKLDELKEEDDIMKTVSVNNTMINRMKETIELMKNGTPIIYQGVIFNSNRKIYGIPDLIIRSDYINKIFEVPVISENQIGSRFNSDWHYRIIDIKFSTLKLKANLTTMLNHPNQKAYKAQMYIYNLCLDYIQDYMPNKAYILGRGWSGTLKNETYFHDDPFNKPGIIDYDRDDKQIITETIDAINWYKKLKTEGHKWNILPKPTIPELYPNMSNSSISNWENVKKNLADILKEITSIWQCGYEARITAHSNRIFRWDDNECTAANLGINGPKMRPVVDSILTINRSNEHVIYPSIIKNNLYNWRTIQKNEFFIDFESVNAIYDIEQTNNGMIYMIGLGYIRNDKWNYKNFLVSKLSISEETRIIQEFINTVNILSNNDNSNNNNSNILIDTNYLECTNCQRKYRTVYNSIHMLCSCTFMYCPVNGWWDGNAQCMCDSSEYKINNELESKKEIDNDIKDEKKNEDNINNNKNSSIKLYHYSHAERTLFNSALLRAKIIDNNFEFCDLYDIIKSEPIVIKGSLDFSLKSIVNALNNLDKISVSYNDSKLKSGMDGLLTAIIAAKELENNISFEENSLVQDTIKYNEVDTKALYEILTYFRQNH